MSDYPNLSILTPVYDRSQFLEIMICNLRFFNYPKNKLEWVVCDSFSKDRVQAPPLFKDENEINAISRALGIKIIYHFRPEALSIGKKRNILVKMASYNHLINMDSDDIYLSDYLRYSIDVLKKNKVTCVGSPQMLFIYPNDNYKITGISCKELRQIHEATMAFTRKHWRRQGGFCQGKNKNSGEGTQMVDGTGAKHFMKTEINNIMLCICHDNNTVDKSQFNSVKHQVDGLDQSTVERIPQIKILKKIFTEDNGSPHHQ